VVADIQNEYGPKVSVNEMYFYSEEGLPKIEQYGIGIEGWNAIVINYERVLLGYINETYVKEIVEAYLTDSVHDVSVIKVMPYNSTVEVGEKVNIIVTTKNLGIENASFSVKLFCNGTLIGTQLATDLNPNQEVSMNFVWDTINQTSGGYVLEAEAGPVANETNLANNIYVYSKIEIRSSPSSLVAMVLLAFSFGFFETFSPCLIVLLSFVLSYTVGEAAHFKEGFLRVMTFGTGFISATLLLAVALGLLLLSTPVVQYSLTWIVCVFAIILGLNLLGVLRIPSRTHLQSKPLIKRLARRHVVTYAGLFLLGFVFYFLDPCIAPIFVSMMPLLLPETLFFSLLVFCLGAIILFIGIGVFAGSVSKLARSAYRHRFKIRAISGLILISYALYLVIFYLVPTIK
jgi:cytochrome c biogenesis protein CcdA